MEPAKTGQPARGGDSGTVNRVLRILGCFAEKERWGLNELARALDLPRGTTHRLLALCKPLSFVTQDDDGLYMPGIELYRLAGKLAADMPTNRLAEPVLREIRDRTDETVILTLLVRNELKMFFSLSVSPDHPLRYTIDRNRLQPLAWGATGRVLLAFLSPDEIDDVIRRAEPSPLDGRALLAGELRPALKRIRASGFAVSFGERAPEAHGIAVPFFDRQGEIRGNLTLTIPDFRYDAARQDEWIALLRKAAADLMRRLGWS